MEKDLLISAIKNRDLGTVREALSSGADINDKKGENSPLLEALRYSSFDICSFLIENGARLRRNGKERGYARLVVTTWAKEEQIRYFIDRKVVKTGGKGYGPLHKLAKEGRPELLSFYIDAGERIMGKTIYFTGKGTLERVRENKTPLHYAAMAPEPEYNERERFERRQYTDAAVTPGGPESTEAKRSPERMEQIKAGKLEAAELLMQHGADPNVLDSKKCSPLFYAARDRFRPMVELLLNGGADPRIGKNPAVAAYMEGDLELAERIETVRK